MPLLTEVYRFVREAKFDWSKFSDDPRAPAHPGHERDPKASAGSTMADLPGILGAEKEDVPVTYKELVPQPFNNGSFKGSVPVISPDEGIKLGLARIPGFGVNTKHWAKGTAKDGIEWTPGVFIKPISKEAQEFAEIIRSYHLKAFQVYNDNVWNKHFRQRFGMLGD